MKRIDPSELSGEADYDLRAAFGDDTVDGGRLIELEPDDLVPVETPDYRLKHVLKEGDWVTIQHNAGNVTSGPVTDVDTVGFTMDPRNRVTSGYFGYGDFRAEGTTERGVVNELIDINGEPGQRVIERREAENEAEGGD